jgi:hypothetical protein
MLFKFKIMIKILYMNSIFNIENYKKSDLIEMFGLCDKYTSLNVETQENILLEGIIKNTILDAESKRKTIEFINEAKQILMKDVDVTIGNIYNTNLNLTKTPLESDFNHDIQERKTQPFIYSSPSEYFAGVINPLKRRVTIKNLSIDTRFRQNYYSTTSTNIHIELPLKISKVVSMQLSSIELPTTFYTISKQLGNHFFTLSISSNTTIITIPDGNYAPSDLVDYLNSTIQGLGAPFSDVIFVLNIILGTKTGSGQLIAGIKDPATITNFSLNFQADINGNEDKYTPLPLKLGWLLGFRCGIYENNSSYVSEGIVETSGTRYLFVVVDDHNNNVNNGFYSAFSSSLLNNNILARIALQSNYFNIFSENNLTLVTTPRDYYGPVDIQKLDIQLLDEYGRVLNINNMDYSLCIKFTTIYDL